MYIARQNYFSYQRSNVLKFILELFTAWSLFYIMRRYWSSVKEIMQKFFLFSQRYYIGTRITSLLKLPSRYNRRHLLLYRYICQVTLWYYAVLLTTIKSIWHQINKFQRRWRWVTSFENYCSFRFLFLTVAITLDTSRRFCPMGSIP